MGRGHQRDRREAAECEPKEAGNPSHQTTKKERPERGAFRRLASCDLIRRSDATGRTPETAPKEPTNQATTAAVEGVNHASERESVFKREKAERFALEHHLGEQSFAELQTAMTDAGLLPAKNRYTTQDSYRT